MLIIVIFIVLVVLIVWYNTNPKIDRIDGSGCYWIVLWYSPLVPTYTPLGDEIKRKYIKLYDSKWFER